MNICTSQNKRNYLIHSDVHGNPVHTPGRRRFQGDSNGNEGQDME